jgi:hypothetical protein
MFAAIRPQIVQYLTNLHYVNIGQPTAPVNLRSTTAVTLNNVNRIATTNYAVGLNVV